MLTTLPLWEFVYSSHTTQQPKVTSGDIEVRVYPDWYTSVSLEWVIPSSWGDCSFDILRSESEEGPFTKLNSGSLKTNAFSDPAPQQTSKFINDYYIVVVNKPDGTSLSSRASTWKNLRNNWVQIRAREILRRQWVLLRKFVGVDSVVFKRRTYGKRCPNCWDPKVRKATQAHCQVCFGTTFDGGYFDGIPTLIQFNPVVKNSTLSYPGRLEEDNPTAWTIAYPSLNYLDLIYRVDDNKVFRVAGVQPTELQGQMIRQLFSIKELSKGSVEYRLVANYHKDHVEQIH